MRHLVTALAVALTAATPILADLTVEDGGYEVSVTVGNASASVRRDNFRVKGTGKDAKDALSIANKRTSERHEELGKTVDRMVSAHFASAPLVVEKPVHVHHYHSYPVPVGVYVDRWVTPRQFYSTNGSYWRYYNGYWHD